MGGMNDAGGGRGELLWAGATVEEGEGAVVGDDWDESWGSCAASALPARGGRRGGGVSWGVEKDLRREEGGDRVSTALSRVCNMPAMKDGGGGGDDADDDDEDNDDAAAAAAAAGGEDDDDCGIVAAAEPDEDDDDVGDAEDKAGSVSCL